MMERATTLLQDAAGGIFCCEGAPCREAVKRALGSSGVRVSTCTST
jgi:hypothetical protein